jgi:hypothetical protein
MEHLTVALPPAVVAGLIRWHLACGDDRFFEATECAGLDADEESGRQHAVILLQCVRALPRAGLTGCSIMISDVTGRTIVTFSAAGGPSWAAQSEQELLREKVVSALEGHIRPEPDLPSGADLLAQATRLVPPARRPRSQRRLTPAVTQAAVPKARPAAPKARPAGAVPAAARKAALAPAPAALADASPTLQPAGLTVEDTLSPSLELARLIANDPRTADDLPDLNPDGPGPITQIEALSEADVQLIWPGEAELQPYGAWAPPD